jgi:alpha-beta hydrolase superfamily lysophospholipase
MTILLLLLIILLVFTTTLLIVEMLLFQPFKGTATIWLHHSDLNGRKVLFKSGRNELSGWFYGEDNDNAKGLIIISHAMGVTSEYYLPEIMYFADRGYKVFAFDNTGYGYNKGLFCGFPQAVKGFITYNTV